jgi:hypothetical protein
MSIDKPPEYVELDVQIVNRPSGPLRAHHYFASPEDVRQYVRTLLRAALEPQFDSDIEVSLEESAP